MEHRAIKPILLLMFCIPGLHASQETVTLFPVSYTVPNGTQVTYLCTSNIPVEFIQLFLSPTNTLIQHDERVDTMNSTMATFSFAALHSCVVQCFVPLGNTPLTSAGGYLNVQGLLERVGNLSMNSSGFVTWVPPFTLDGVPIDGYNLEVSNGLHTHVINNFPNTSINLAEHGVQCGMLYNVTVTAINSVGTGASHHTTGDFECPPHEEVVVTDSIVSVAVTKSSAFEAAVSSSVLSSVTINSTGISTTAMIGIFSIGLVLMLVLMLVVAVAFAVMIYIKRWRRINDQAWVNPGGTANNENIPIRLAAVHPVSPEDDQSFISDPKQSTQLEEEKSQVVAEQTSSVGTLMKIEGSSITSGYSSGSGNGPEKAPERVEEQGLEKSTWFNVPYISERKFSSISNNIIVENATTTSKEVEPYATEDLKEETKIGHSSDEPVV